MKLFRKKIFFRSTLAIRLNSSKIGYALSSFHVIFKGLDVICFRFDWRLTVDIVDIELVGSSDWVTSQKKELKGVSISSKITDTKKSKLRKSGKSLFEFITEHSGLPQEQRLKLIKYMEGLNLVQN